MFAVEGARLMPKRDLSFKFLVGYAKSPLDLTVPGIGTRQRRRSSNYVATFDMAFGMSLSDRRRDRPRRRRLPHGDRRRLRRARPLRVGRR